jgi:multicomponent Na+:H+ antiporter subunit G
MDIVAAIFIVSGAFFFLTATIGLLRFPDFYTRMHATGKGDTLGSLLILFGLALHNGFSLPSLKIILIAVFIFITSPTATHSIAKAALKNKIPLWTKENKK